MKNKIKDKSGIDEIALDIYHGKLFQGDAIIVKRRNPSYSNLMKSYGLFEELWIEELERDKHVGIIMDKNPKKEIIDSGKVLVYIKSEYIYLHYSDFKKISQLC